MRFKSKKNRVILKEGLVIKSYLEQHHLQQEAKMLKKLQQAGLAVPALIRENKDSLLLEYIPGVTYYSLVEKMTVEQALALTNWLADYHSITKLLKGDVNLRNFLWTGKTCVGLDFEDAPLTGRAETDQGKILAFCATYRPAFTENKLSSAQLLLQSFRKNGGDQKIIRQAYLGEIKAMNVRRTKEKMPLQKAVSFFDKLENN